MKPERSIEPKLVLWRLFLSALATVMFGMAALILYLFFSHCWNGMTDCAAYSPTRKWIAFLLAPPIFVMQRWFFGTVDNVSNFDPVVYGKFGWAVLWVYYYVLIFAVAPLIKNLVAPLIGRFRRT